jgi:O-antigen/teichoic acid export membrane protein
MRRTLQSLSSAVINDRVIFVIVNVAVNLLFLVRSYVTMRVLGYAHLGLVALLQTIVLLVGAMQLGVVNGGYRLLCSEGNDDSRLINNFVFTFIGTLASALLAAAACILVLARDSDYALVTCLAVFAGIFTIAKNWMTNYLIAKIKLRKLNGINLVSALVSIVPLVFVGSSPLIVCLVSIVLQPLVFAVYLLATEKALRPTAPAFSLDLFKRVLSAGFVVFLTGMFLMANSQIERWSIVSYLGVDGLGRFYLALLFLNMYSLIPSSLDAIFLPKVIQAHVRQDYAGMQLDMRRFLNLTLCYSVLAVLSVWLLSRVLIGFLLPKYLEDLRYVYLVMPGTVLFGLTSPFAIVFNVLIRYRFYFYAYGLGTLATAVLLGAYIYAAGSIDLTALCIIKSVVSISMGIVLVTGYVTVSRMYPAFRFDPFRVKRMAVG